MPIIVFYCIQTNLAKLALRSILASRYSVSVNWKLVQLKPDNNT
jgi:hypothetical protein